MNFLSSDNYVHYSECVSLNPMTDCYYLSIIFSLSSHVISSYTLQDLFQTKFNEIYFPL